MVNKKVSCFFFWTIRIFDQKDLTRESEINVENETFKPDYTEEIENL